MGATSPAAPADPRLDAVVARVLQADDVPAFSKAMQELMAAIGRDDDSAQRLANVVLRDYALTVKVLRAANTAHYNRGGRPVQSATHALMLLGARTVRDLASALLLFEHYRRRSPGLKELMLLSLLTASTARAAAERCGARVDPDAAHLAGMFRNLGEVLAAAHLPDEYAAALRAPDAAGAVRAALGCSYEDLGAVVARHWGMPERVRVGMRAAGGAGEDLGDVCTAFAHDLTAAVHRGDAAVAPRALDRILARYGERLHLTREALAGVAERAVQETREVFAAAGVRLDDLRLARQIAAALRGAPECAPGEGDASGPAAPDAGAGATAAPAEPEPLVATEALAGPGLDAVRAQLGRELAAAAADEAGYDVGRVLLLALEVVLRGGPFDRACFHAADPVAGEFRPRIGLGDGIEQVLGGLGVPFAAARGPTGPALLRGDEVHLARGVRHTLAESQLLRRWGAASAALYPVRVGGAVIGCVHAGRHTNITAPDAAATRHVREVARALELAFERRRGAALLEPAPAAYAAAAMSVKMDAVLRVLRGEPLETVAASVGADADALATWRTEFLAGAAARLAAAIPAGPPL